MKKYLIITLAFFALMVIIGALFLSRLKGVTPTIVNQAAKPGSEVLETGQETACTSNNDCWCRSFDGTGFKPGKAPSACNQQTKKCIQCYYE